MAEWISVKDRLPQENEIVLCWKNKGGFFIGQYTGLRYTEDVYAFVAVGAYVAVGTTHWQQLPQPPKGE